MLSAWGDEEDLKSAERFDSVQRSWIPIASMHSERRFHSAFELDTGEVLVIGGSQASAELYDPSADCWVKTSPSGVPLVFSALVGATPTGDIFVGPVSEYGRSTVPRTTVIAAPAAFDPSTQRWRTLTAPSARLSATRPIQLPDGEIVLIGGFRTLDVLRYVAATDAWTNAMPSSRR